MKLIQLLEASYSGKIITDSNGKPLKLYRGIRGSSSNGIHDDAIKGEPRVGYATFLSNNPHVANTYGTPDHSFDESGAVVPVYVKASKIIEFPTKLIKYSGGTYKSFDKFEFDDHAQRLQPGEVLVVRGIVDAGPRTNSKIDPEKRWSYASDVYALGKGTIVISAVSNPNAEE